VPASATWLHEETSEPVGDLGVSRGVSVVLLARRFARVGLAMVVPAEPVVLVRTRTIVVVLVRFPRRVVGRSGPGGCGGVGETGDELTRRRCRARRNVVAGGVGEDEPAGCDDLDLPATLMNRGVVTFAQQDHFVDVRAPTA